MGGERQGELTPDDEVGGHREAEGETTTHVSWREVGCTPVGGSQLVGSVIKTSARQVIIKHSG